MLPRFPLIAAVLLSFGAAPLVAQDLAVTPFGWVYPEDAPDSLPDLGESGLRGDIPEKVENLPRPTYARIDEILGDDGAPLARSIMSEFPWLQREARELYMASPRPKPAKRGGKAVASAVEYFLVFNPPSASLKPGRSTPRLIRPATVFVPTDKDAPEHVFVEFEFQVDATGHATDLRPVDEKVGRSLVIGAKATLGNWLFAPAERDRKPVPASVIIPVLYAQRAMIESTAADQPPVQTLHVPVEYPAAARRAGVTGSVLIALVVDVEGRTRDLHVIRSSHRVFDKAAFDSLKKWKFRPAVKNGVPVAVRMVQPISFSLEENPASTPLSVIYDAKKIAKLPPELQWDKAPVYSEIEPAVYPFELLNAGKEGFAQVAFVVGPNGRVVESQAVEASDPAFAGAALAMIETFRFEPASNKGRPAHALLALRVKFDRSGGVLVPHDSQMVKTALRMTKEPGSFARPKDLDRPLTLWMGLDGTFPLSAKGQPSGTAVVEYVIDTAGLVQTPRVDSATSPAFGFAAAQAVASMRFAPPAKDGHPVEVLVTDKIKLTPKGCERESL